MSKEQITDKEAITTLIIFIYGSTLVLGIGGNSKNNAWIAGAIGMVMTLPMITVYARIISLFRGKDLFEILELCLGKIAGKAVSLIYIWYAFHLGTLVLRNFAEFINTVTMPETPRFVIHLMVGVVCIFAVNLGVEIIARISAYLLPILLGVLIIIYILGMGEWNMENFLPIMHKALKNVLMGGFSAFAFPFTETVIFMGVFYTLKNKKSPYKVYYFSTIFAGLIIVMLTARNIAILGNMTGMLYFPSHVAVARISVGTFLQRMEVSVAFVFLISILIKTSVCLFVACKGISRVFALKDYRVVAIQLGLFMISFAQFIYDNIMEMKYWAFKVYQYYAFPMEVVLPLIIWIFAEVKHRKMQDGNKLEGAQ